MPSGSWSTRKTRRSSRAPARRPTSRAASSQIKHEIEDTTSDYDKEKLQERLAKLAGGVAVINVGAATETEMKEKKARVEDALHATRAAVEEGIVPGGGVALIRCLPALDKLARARGRREGRRRTSSSAPSRSRCAPLRENAGVEGSVVVEGQEGEEELWATTSTEMTYVDMFEAGIIDPTKVARTALQNAASVASLLLTTEAVVTELPEKEKAPMPGMGGGGMGDMGGMGGMSVGVGLGVWGFVFFRGNWFGFGGW